MLFVRQKMFEEAIIIFHSSNTSEKYQKFFVLALPFKLIKFTSCLQKKRSDRKVKNIDIKLFVKYLLSTS